MAPFRKPSTHGFERIANFRDMGGHRTHDGRLLRSGVLFRSGHLGRATDADVERLASLGVRRVFDFRTESDIRTDGADRLPPGTEHVRLPMPDPARGEDIRSLIASNSKRLQEIFGDGRAAEMMERGAAHIATQRIEPYAQFVAGLCSDGAFPALFHCSAGKDRAGWAGSVILLALGVPEDEIREQYLLSNRAVDALRRQGENDPGEWHEVLRPLLEVREEYLEASFAAVRSGWGDTDTYLREALGLDDGRRAHLRAQLLE